MAHSGDDDFEICETWEQAKSVSRGYDDHRLMQELQRLQTRSLPSEKCGQLGSRYIELLAALTSAAIHQQHHHLRVLDVGGGDASMYRAIEPIIGNRIHEWVVLETEACASRFQSGGQDPRLRWTASSEGVESLAWDIVLFSGAIQYLPNPDQSLRLFTRISANVIVMRSPLHDGPEHVPAVQRPKGKGYIEANSSMPVWFLSRTRLLSSVVDLANTVYQWTTPSETWSFDGRTLDLSGFLLRCHR